VLREAVAVARSDHARARKRLAFLKPRGALAKILLIGATGNSGRRILTLALQRAHEVTAFVRRATRLLFSNTPGQRNSVRRRLSLLTEDERTLVQLRKTVDFSRKLLAEEIPSTFLGVQHYPLLNSENAAQWNDKQERRLSSRVTRIRNVAGMVSLPEVGGALVRICRRCAPASRFSNR
jgi:hypothetical protein